ncbi:hypothetical protein V5O48_007518 [Marasmius crinis-equi]|uniref:Uncharacterized protein n=1 Tax=Marasmius crinis-equi TaxID=585013 RepID=A0ABR3FGW4_9AGAR
MNANAPAANPPSSPHSSQSSGPPSSPPPPPPPFDPPPPFSSHGYPPPHSGPPPSPSPSTPSSSSSVSSLGTPVWHIRTPHNREKRPFTPPSTGNPFPELLAQSVASATQSSSTPPATPHRQSKQVSAPLAPPQDQPNRVLARVLDLNTQAALDQRGVKTTQEQSRPLPALRMDQMRRMQNHTILVHLYTKNDLPSQAIDVVVEAASWPVLDPRRYVILEGFAGIGAFNSGYHYYDQDRSLWRFTLNPLDVSSKRPVFLALKHITTLPTPILKVTGPTVHTGGETSVRTPRCDPQVLNVDLDQTPTAKAAVEVANPIQLLNDTDWCESDGFSYLQTAPPSDRRRPFPFKYARDMHEAFIKIAAFETEHPTYKQKQLFLHAALPGEFVSSTFSSHYQTWKNARHSQELRQAVQAGRTTEGEWSRIRNNYDRSH